MAHRKRQFYNQRFLHDDPDSKMTGSRSTRYRMQKRAREETNNDSEATQGNTVILVPYSMARCIIIITLIFIKGS